MSDRQGRKKLSDDFEHPAAGSSAAEPRTVRAGIEQRLRQMILSSRFAPGTHLSDRALCEEFGASRSIVREAIRALEVEGLVTIYPNRGPFVTAISTADAVQIYELRAALEGLAGEGFALRASEDERQRLQEAFEAICQETERLKLLKLKHDFYEILLNGCRNVFAKQTLQQYLNRITQLRLTSMAAPGRRQNTLRELQQIMTAIHNRDAEGAALACREHVRSAAAVAIAALRKEEQAKQATSKLNGSARRKSKDQSAALPAAATVVPNQPTEG